MAIRDRATLTKLATPPTPLFSRQLSFCHKLFLRVRANTQAQKPKLISLAWKILGRYISSHQSDGTWESRHTKVTGLGNRCRESRRPAWMSRTPPTGMNAPRSSLFDKVLRSFSQRCFQGALACGRNTSLEPAVVFRGMGAASQRQRLKLPLMTHSATSIQRRIRRRCALI